MNMPHDDANIMLDMETLGTRPGCVLLSIAAVPFSSLFPIESFYQKILPSSCSARGLHTDAATVAWWEKQASDVREEAFSGTEDIYNVLSRFSEYCASLPRTPIIWGNGSDFDCAILAETYRLLHIPLPWKYTNSRCYRTLKNLFPQVPYVKPRVAHNALEDAKAQGAHAAQIFQYIGKRSWSNVEKD